MDFTPTHRVRLPSRLLALQYLRSPSVEQVDLTEDLQNRLRML